MFFVATPNFNSSRFLPDAIESVRMQGLTDTRHHIQDAVSDDGFESIVDDHGWPGLTYTREPDGGQSDALNRCFTRIGQSQYVSWLNADEFYLPFAFQQMAAFFQANPAVGYVFGDTVHIDERGRVLRLVAQHKPYPAVLQRYGTFIQTSSTFFRAELYQQGLLLLKPEFKQVMDLELFCRLADAGVRGAYFPHALSAFRIHSGQVTARNGAEVSARERISIPSMRNSAFDSFIGRIAHSSLKLLNGAIIREVKFGRRFGAHARSAPIIMADA